MKNIDNLIYLNRNSEYVFVNFEKMKLFLNKIQDFNYNYWLTDISIFKSEREMIIFSFICESLNFCFWKNTDWKIIYKEKYYQGSEALFYALLKAIDSGEISMNIENLIEINEDKFNSIFKSQGIMPILMNERYKLFYNTVYTIKLKGDKFFKELFSISNDNELVKYIIDNFKHFNDESIFKERTIHFNKRAILLVNDLYNLSETIRNNIKNIDSLTGCADYSIPKVFLAFGIFEYSNELLSKVCSKKLIEHNSQMEIEIRGNTLYVIEMMIEYLNKNHVNINSVQLDNIIWKMRRSIICDVPLHRTKCIYY